MLLKILKEIYLWWWLLPVILVVGILVWPLCIGGIVDRYLKDNGEKIWKYDNLLYSRNSMDNFYHHICFS